MKRPKEKKIFSKSKKTKVDRKANKSKIEIEIEIGKTGEKAEGSNSSKNVHSSVEWATLEHEGPLFAPEYVNLPEHVQLVYDGKPVRLGTQAEEVATLYTKLISRKSIIKDVVFCENFLRDWRECMTEDERAIITDLQKCDFTQIFDFYKTNQTEVEIDDEAKKTYGFCLLDGQLQKVENYRLPCPQLYLGAGRYKGSLRKRLGANDVSINIGEEAEIPKAPGGLKWKEVCHDKSGIWLAKWKTHDLAVVQCMKLVDKSEHVAKREYQRFEQARKLGEIISNIRNDYEKDFGSVNWYKRQRSVVLYFIDRLALETDKKDEVEDTVNCCNIQVKDIELFDETKIVKFNSFKLKKTVTVEEGVFNNVKSFMESKSKNQLLFNLDPSRLFDYLNAWMEGLTAKVFRTFNASHLFQEMLNSNTDSKMNQQDRILTYHRANRSVADFLDHIYKTPKLFYNPIQPKLEMVIKIKKKQIESIKSDLDNDTFLTKTEVLKLKLEKNTIKQKSMNKKIQKLKRQIETIRIKDGIVTTKEKNVIKGKQKMIKCLQVPLKPVDEIIRKLTHQINANTSTTDDNDMDESEKGELRERSLKKLKDVEKELTSLQSSANEKGGSGLFTNETLHYIDPRITVSWCKKYDVPITKIYNEEERKLFSMAIEETDSEFLF